MPDRSQLSQLIDRLLKLTADDKVDWAETANEDAFTATLGKFAITISREKGSWDSASFLIQVHDRVGKLIDDATGVELSEYRESHRQSPADVLGLLHEAARRKALNVQGAMSELLSSLDALD